MRCCCPAQRRRSWVGGIDVRVAASNDKSDLEHDQMDIAIRAVPRGADTPNGERLFDCDIFPVCSPALARDGAHPLRNPADLAYHARLDCETIRDGRPWSEWDVWFDAMKIPAVEPASTPPSSSVKRAAIERLENPTLGYCQTTVVHNGANPAFEWARRPLDPGRRASQQFDARIF